jgi:hypothetical protein
MTNQTIASIMKGQLTASKEKEQDSIPLAEK